MMASRGMGAVRASKMPKPKVIKKRDGDYPVDVYAEGGPVGLYANISAKKKRIASGSGEKMRKVGSKGAPTKADFIKSAKTAKK
jgi:hypothetical protein